MSAKKLLFVLLATLAIAIGLYPLFMLLTSLHFDLFDSKSKELLANTIWNIGFYTHISFGGIALLIGWTGFSRKLRVGNIKTHRVIGKAYVIAALLSALGGIYISLFTTGGLIPSTGFISLGLIWFYTTLKAYLFAREKKFTEHEKMMIYSYAACFAAVTLRIWLPFFKFLFHDFEIAYKIVAWWCWVPNLYVAYILIKRKDKITTLNTLKKMDKI